MKVRVGGGVGVGVVGEGGVCGGARWGVVGVVGVVAQTRIKAGH